MRRFTLLCGVMAGGASAFLLPTQAPQRISSSVLQKPSPSPATVTASTVTPIKEPDLTEADMINPPQTFFECILKVRPLERRKVVRSV